MCKNHLKYFFERIFLNTSKYIFNGQIKVYLNKKVKEKTKNKKKEVNISFLSY
jgi:hypothetical protein